jgi:hypothetical protein
VTLKGWRTMADASHLFTDPATLEHKFAVLKQQCEALDEPNRAFFVRP